MTKSKIIKLILVILWMGLIFVFSSQDGYESTKTSDTFFYKVIDVVTGNKLIESEKIELAEKYIPIVRKGAHFFLYFVLAILVFILLKEYAIVRYKLIIYTLIWVILYSISDEVHQLFVPGRVGSIKDVLIDSGGGILSTMICYLTTRRNK